MDEEKKYKRRKLILFLSIGSLFGILIGIVFLNVVSLIGVYDCVPTLKEFTDEIKKTEEFYGNEVVPQEKRQEFYELAQFIVDTKCPNDTITITWDDINAETGEIISSETFKTLPSKNKPTVPVI